MKIEIKNRWTRSVLFEGDFSSVAAAVVAAVAKYANLSYADLSYANLIGADLSGTDLSNADLSYADLSYANLIGADLSGAKSFQLASEYLKQFDRDEKGIIVFRSQLGERNKPDSWKFEPGAFLTENPNPDRACDCACGVNFATLEWVKQNYNDIIWKCRINWEDLADVVVPFNTPGKARCARLELLEVVS